MILVLGREVSNLDDGKFTRFPVVSWREVPTCSTYIRCLSASSRESVLWRNHGFGVFFSQTSEAAAFKL